MAWLAECLRQKGYALRLSGLLPPAPLRRQLPPCEPPQTVLPHSDRVILSIPTAGADGLLRTPTVPERYPLAECLELLPEGESAQLRMFRGIVRSLCSLDEVTSVQVLVDGEMRTSFGAVDISQPLSP